MTPGELGRTLVAGSAATAAVTAAMRYARRRGWTTLEFPRVLATTLGADNAVTRPVGWALFVGNGALLALGYRQAARLTGTRASAPRGALMGLLHGLVAAGLAAALSPFHPRPHQAGLTRWTDRRPPARGVGVLVGVHVLYGATLGALTRRRAAHAL